MKTLIPISIILIFINTQAFAQNIKQSDSTVLDFKFLSINYNNHFGTAYKLTIDSNRKIIYRPSPEITMGNKIVTGTTSFFTQIEFNKFLKKLTNSLITILEKRQNVCGIDEATKDFNLIIGTKNIVSKGFSLEPELKSFVDYLAKLYNNGGVININKD